MTQTIISSGDGSNPLTLVNGNDGSLIIQSGIAGSKVNALSIAPDGTITLLKPALQKRLSSVRLKGNNGVGASSTAIQRLTTIIDQYVGEEFAYADSASLGGSFTILKSGNFAMSFSGNFNTANHMGITLNTAQLTTSISALSNVNEVLQSMTSPSANYNTPLSWQGPLVAGDVVRLHTTTGGVVSGSSVGFGVTFACLNLTAP